MSESKNNICEKCSKKEEKKNEEKKEIKEFPCEKCGIVVLKKSELKKHMKQCYGIFKSPYNGEKFNIFSSLIDIRENYLKCSLDENEDCEEIFMMKLDEFFRS